MKCLKTTVLITALLLICQISFSQNTSSTTFVQNIKGQGAMELNANLHGEIEFKTWSQDYIRILITVESETLKKPCIKQLATKKYFKIIGHYDLESEIISLMMPAFEEKISVNGKQLKEKVKMSFKMFVPEGMNVEQMKNKEVIANSM